MRSRSIRISITIPAALLKRVDQATIAAYTSRSDIIRYALLEWLSRHPELTPTETAVSSTEKSIASLPATTKPKRKFPPPDEILFKDLLKPGMSPEEMLELLMEYEKQYPNL